MSLSGNNLSSIDVSKNANLKKLSVITNPMNTLDISGCPILCNLVKTTERKKNAVYDFDIWQDDNDNWLDVNLDVTVTAGDFVSNPRVVTPIDSITISVAPPAAGSTAETKPVVTLPSDAKYTLNIDRCNWLNDEYCDHDGEHQFVAGETCRAYICLTPNEGYEFNDSTTIAVTNGSVDSTQSVTIRQNDIICFVVVVKVPEAQQQTTPETQQQEQQQQEQQQQQQEQQTEPKVSEKKLNLSIKGLKLTASGTKAIKISWTKLNKKDQQKIGKFIIEVSTDKKFTKDVITKPVSAKKDSVTIKKLKPGKKYYVRIRAIKEDGNVLYTTKWFKKNITLKKK